MDRERLKDIQTAELSESNVNEDFVLWLKTKAPTYLLVFMVIIVGYLFLVRYQQGQSTYRAEAWLAYLEATASGLPASHEDVAQLYADVDAIQGLGLINAGDAYLQSVILDQTIGGDASFVTVLSQEDRTFYLDKADGLYQRVIELDDNTPSSVLLVISGLNGRAAVAETKGDFDGARGFYESVITRANTQYPSLATQAQKRIDSLSDIAVTIFLPTDAEVTARNNQILKRDSKPLDATIDSLTDLTDSNSE